MKGSEAIQAPFTLGLGASLLRPAHMWGLVLALLGLPVLVLAGLVFAIGAGDDEAAGTGRVLETVWGEFLQDPGNRLLLWALAVLAPLAGLCFLAQRLAWIRVTPMGLQVHVPRWLGVGIFRQTAGRWDLRWQDVRRARLVAPAGGSMGVQQLGWYRLVIETDRGETWLNPFPWFDRSGADHRLGLGELLAFRRLDAARRVRSAPLMNAVEARGFEIEAAAGDAPGAAGFDLARHKGMLVQLGVLFGAGLYALGDTLVAGYRPLEPVPLLPFAAAGVLAAAAAAVLGRGAPRIERLGVGALATLAVAAAVYPATLRLNALSAEPRVAVYTAVAPGVFEPRAAGLPGIDLSGEDVDEYWTQYPPGTTHTFTLLRGSAGFHQLDLAPFYERTRRFYSRDRGDT